MLYISMRLKKLRLGIAFLFLTGTNLFAQTPGMIYENQGISVLDPNGDGYVSKLPSGFVGNDQSDSEIPYIPIVLPANEPNSDLGPGPDCGFTDFVQQAVGVQDAGQQYFDLAGNNWLFRIRLGGTSPNSKSYSILVDLDQKFGATGPNADPNYVNGNPGFEIEIVLATNFGVLVYDVNGTTTPILRRSYPIHTHHHKAIALSMECGNPDYFYDFYVPIAHLTTDFGFTANTPVRVVLLNNMGASTSSIAKPTSMSDIGGLDDAAYGGNLELAFNDIINNYTPTCATCPVGLDRSACPIITGNYSASSTTVSGTSTEANGTVIQVYINGVAAGASVTVNNGSWTRTGLTLNVGNVITATATAPGKGVSIDNCSSKTVANCSTISSTSGITIAKVSGGKGFTLTPTAWPTGTIVRWYTAEYALALVESGYGTPLYIPNPVTTASTNQTVSFDCKTGQCFPNGVYYFTVQKPGECESAFLASCLYSATGTSTTPAISTTTVATSTTSISGTCGNVASPGVAVKLYVDGVLLGSTTAIGTTSWTINGLNLTGKRCGVITVEAADAGRCPTVGSSTRTITEAAESPSLLQESCISAPLTSVRGITTESHLSATVALFSFTAPSTYTAIPGSGSIASNGVWTFVPSLPISAGTTIVAAITDASNCKTQSAYSTPVALTSAPAINASTTINSPVTEDDLIISGTGINGEWVQLYVDDAIPYKMVSGNLTAIGRVQVVGGVWSVAVDNYSIYAGAKLRVSVANASTGGCESALSSSFVTVQCTAPALPNYVGGSKSYCVGGAGEVILTNTEQGVIYQLVNGAGVAVGPTVAGNGADVSLFTYALGANLNGVFVRAFNLLNSSCVVVSTTAINFDTPSPSPDITFTNSNVSVSRGNTSASFVYGSPVNSPTHYAVSFSIAAKNQGFVDVSLTAMPVSPIVLTVPAGAVAGSYSAVMTISNAGSCGTSKNITITVFEAGSAPIVTLHPANKSACEGDGTTLTVAATGTPTSYQWQYSTDDGYSWAPVSGGNYTGAGSATLNIINVTGLNGYKYNCVLGNANGSVTSNHATLTVLANPSVTLHPSEQTVCQPNGVSFSFAQSNATSLKWQVDAGAGYTDITDGGVYSGASTTTLGISNTTGMNGYLFRAVAMNSCSDAFSNDALLTVNDCTTPVVTLSAGAASIGENGGSTNITATLSSAVAEVVTVTLAYSGTASGSDFSGATTIVIPAGQLSANTTVTAINDFVYEGNETIVAEITSVVNALENGNQSVTIIIVDDEAVPSIAIANASATEGNDLEFVVSLSNASIQTISVDYVTSNGSALAGVDYTAISGTLTFVPGETSLLVFVSTIQDALVEGNEGFNVLLSNPMNASIADGSAAGTIVDNDSYPVAFPDTYSVLEGGSITIDAPGVLANDTDVDGNTLAAILVSDVTYGTLILNANGSFTYTHVGDENVSDSFTYRVNDGANDGNTVTVTINVTPVNDAPNFTKGADQTVNEDAAAQSVSNWATSISAGPTNESAQTVSFTVTNNNNALFSVQPAISATGTLTYTPAANASGTATVTVRLTDNGGTANGGINESAEQTFVITVNPINDAPSFTKGADQTVNEDAAAQSVSNWATSISAGPTNESAQTVSFTVTNNNNALFSVQPAISATGTLTYTPAANASGTATVTVRLTDNGGTANGGVDQSAEQTFVITVNPINDAPSFTKGADQTVNEDAAAQSVSNWATSISAGPTNESAQTVSFTVTNNNNALFSVQPAISATGTLTYTPAANASGTATVIVRLTDNGGTANGGVDQSAEQTFVITVNPVNDAPSFTKGADQTVNEDAAAQSVSNWATSISAGPANESTQTVSFTVTNNNNALFSVQPAISADGTLTYTPAANASGTATVTVRLTDNGGTANGGINESAEQTFVITVNPVNDAPIFTKGADQTVNEDAAAQSVSNWATSISAGPANESTQTVSFTVTNNNNALFSVQPAISADGTLTYTPSANASGTATVTVRLTDNGGTANGGINESAEQTFVITVNPVNDSPVAVAESYLVDEGAILVVNAPGVLGNDTDVDGDPLTAILVTSTVNGTLALNADGSFTYIHNGSETTSDNFTYKVNDGTIDGNTVTVTFTINPVNDAPVAVADEYDVPMGGTLTIDVANGLLANDTDAENNTLTAVLVDGPTYGTLTLNGDGSFSYEHNGSVTYTDSFTYRADDGTVQGSLVTVTINITGVNNKPVSVADAYSVDEGGTLSVDAPGLLANDTDADNDALTAQMVDDVAHGILTFNADGSFIYVHDGSESLTDAFTYRAYDGKQYGSAVTVTITINPLNDVPVAVVDSYTLNEGATLTVDAANGVLSNDTDAENDALEAILVTSPANGIITLNADGSFTYTHNGSETTSDSFTYKVNDGTEDGSTVTVTFTINPVNDAPVAVADSYTIKRRRHVVY
jgi:VCBS repeat-containing protein